MLWVSLGITGVLYAVIFGTSPLIAGFYEMPELIWPLRVLAIMLFPGALNSIQIAKISREMDFKKVFYSNVGAIIGSGLAGIVLAYLGAGLWALVVQTMANVVIASIVMKFTSKLKIRFVLNFQRIKVLFSFGWKLLVSGLIDTLYQDLQSLVIGKKYNKTTLAFFNKGKQFPHFIMNSINGAVQSVMLPAMSEKQESRDELKNMMRNSISLCAFIVFPLMAGLAAVAEPLVRLLLTDVWLPAVPYLQIYCVTSAFYPIHSCNLQAINAIGRSDIFLKLEIIKKSYGILALIIAVVFFKSPIAIAMTAIITTMISFVVNATPNKKLIGYSYFEQVRDLLPSFAASLTMLAAVWLIGFINLPLILKLVVQVLAGIVIYIVLAVVFKLKPYKLAMEALKNFKVKVSNE